MEIADFEVEPALLSEHLSERIYEGAISCESPAHATIDDARRIS
jgi:hypothetical protein